MVGTTLIERRAHIDALASEDGTYVVVCAHTGDRPVPVANCRFETRSVARRAARAAERYRAALRHYDPQVPYCELIVSQTPGPATPGPVTPGPLAASAAGEHSGPVASRDRVEFCHRLAAAIDAIIEITDWLRDADETPLSALGFDALADRHERLASARRRCDRLAQDRQALLGETTARDGRVAVRHRDLVSTIAEPLSVDHPLLATVLRVEATCADCQRVVRAHLVRRA
ncbi:MAG: DUF7260 family protein [Halococcoides sp.]